MLLSEAILKGSEGRGQCTRAYELPDGRVCVIGAAAKGLNRTHNANTHTDIERAIVYVKCQDLIRMNDDGHMTFQQIIDYIKKENLDVELDAAK